MCLLHCTKASPLFCPSVVSSAAHMEQESQTETSEVTSELSFLSVALPSGCWDQRWSTLTSRACSGEPGMAVSHEPGPDHNHGQNSSEIWEDVLIILMTVSAVGKTKVLLGSKVCMWKPTLALSNKEIKQSHQFSFAPPRGAWVSVPPSKVKLLLSRHFSLSNEITVCFECHFN